MKNIDYPAGHSMDTNWFAVDKDGNVGFFDTGADATMPTCFEEQFSWLDFIEEYTETISGRLHKLLLPEWQVEEILCLCKEEAIVEIMEGFEESGYVFFEGFFVLNEGVTWQDLGIGEALEKSDYDFAVLISEERCLYYISDVYQLESEFAAALSAGKVQACVHADLNSGSNDEGIRVDIGIFKGFEYISQNFAYYPYERSTNPELSLNINQFSEEAQKKVFRFENISFRDFPMLQPIEFVPSNSWGFDYFGEDFESGYARVQLSDGETEAWAAMSLHEWLNGKTRNCSMCNGYMSSWSVDRGIGASGCEQPRVLFIQLHGKTKPQKETICQIMQALGVDEKSWYVTNLVKCLPSNTKQERTDFESRACRCREHLEMEMGIIQPQLIVGLGQEVQSLLENLCLATLADKSGIGTIRIGRGAYPYLPLNVEKDHFENELLELDDLKPITEFILSQVRDLPERPRVKPFVRK